LLIVGYPRRCHCRRRRRFRWSLLIVVSPAVATAAAVGSVFTPPLPPPFRQSS
jgi:hypothetical protein